MIVPKISSSVSSHAAPIAEKATQNILFRIQELVSRINAQLSRLSEQGQERSQTMKKEYRISSAKGADLTKQSGTATLAISILSAVPLVIGLGVGAHLQPVFQFAANQMIPGCGQGYTGHLNAKQMREQSISGLRQTEISNEGQKSGEARDFQSELQQIIGALRQLFQKASS